MEKKQEEEEQQMRSNLEASEWKESLCLSFGIIIIIIIIIARISPPQRQRCCRCLCLLDSI